MADAGAQARLQPSLLDRLTDDEIDVPQDTRDKRVLSMRALRKAVLRDLGWLFNCAALDCLQDLSGHPLAAASVINYGWPNLSGRTASGLDLAEVERLLCQAVWNFEPRIRRDSVRVRASASGGGHPNQIVLELQGELWAQPIPESLYLKTEIDLEIGEIRVYDNDARSH